MFCLILFYFLIDFIIHESASTHLSTNDTLNKLMEDWVR